LRRRIHRFVLLPVRWLWRGVLRAALSWLIFIICLGLTLRWLGLPVPSVSDVLRRFESVAQLADILS
jgi:hypothetical protein